MIRFFLILSSVFLTLNVSGQMDDKSYSAGVMIASDLKVQGLTDLDVDAFAAAVKDVLAGNDLKVSKEDAQEMFRTYLMEAKEKAKLANQKAGADFLAANGKKKGVTTTDSGLQYEVLESSDDPRKPALTDKVNVHYHGTLIDGTVFDSSVDRGEPISFPLNGVIQGWQEGLQLMNVGSKYRLFIPYDLAYGDRAAGPTIAPYSALVFDVTLLNIE